MLSSIHRRSPRDTWHWWFVTFCYSGPQQCGDVMLSCHVSSVICHVIPGWVCCTRLWHHRTPGPWTLDTVDTGHTIMMSSSTDQWWVLGHCTHWTGGAQSAVGHTLYLVPDRAFPSLYLYLGVIYANSLPPPDSSAALTMLPHLGNLLKLAYYSAAADFLNF